MWTFQKMMEGSTNELGVFSFRVRKSKRYEIEVFTDTKERKIGGIEFEADEIK